MPPADIFPFYSQKFNELRKYFYGLKPPHTLDGIRGFNAIYGDIYPILPREERRRAEVFVDELISGVEKKEWACKIFGVV